MTYSFPLKTVIAAIAAVFLSAAVAKAETAVVSLDLNLRDGPGLEYPIIATMPGGSPVDVRGCHVGWCRILWAGYEGFASETYLDFGGYGRVATPMVTPRRRPWSSGRTTTTTMGRGCTAGTMGKSGTSNARTTIDPAEDT